MFIDVILIGMSLIKERKSSFFNRKKRSCKTVCQRSIAICISVTSIFTTLRIIAQKTKIVNKKNKKNKIYFIK